jgi:hypothetical protein
LGGQATAANKQPFAEWHGNFPSELARRRPGFSDISQQNLIIEGWKSVLYDRESAEAFYLNDGKEPATPGLR